MSKANMDIRKLMCEKGVMQIDIAEALGVSAAAMSHSLRRKMSPQKKYIYRLIIEDLARSGKTRLATKLAKRPNRDILARLDANGIASTRLSLYMGYSAATIPHKLRKCELKEWDRVAINAAIDAMIAEGEEHETDNG